MKAFEQLIQVMQQLRDPASGCPWDLAQDHKTIAKYAIEEAYEVVDAIEHGSDEDLKEELGDLLLQVVFHAQMAAEKNRFDIEDVVHAINTKMIERHPHVFDQHNPLTPEEVAQQWETIKNKGQSKRLLGGVPASYPALMKAYTFGQKAAKVGFDWSSLDRVKSKMDEEWGELLQAMASQNDQHIEEELGDFLFVTAQYARKLGYDPELVLQKANAKFAKRLHAVEAKSQDLGRAMQECSVEELEGLWNQVKSTHPIKK
ncbi:MAG: nucleoside triphosphate pyrophosphohydrolase [Deltaproteobacteria bacterium]|nr:nucleoside triphosphate pyrophosphohydrolase [Deltaproteobacteria bacterium]